MESKIYVTIKIPKDLAYELKHEVMREIWKNSKDLEDVNLSYTYIIRRMKKFYLK